LVFSILPENEQQMSAPAAFLARIKIEILSSYFGRFEGTKISFQD
jgi:hypothetical protein